MENKKEFRKYVSMNRPVEDALNETKELVNQGYLTVGSYSNSDDMGVIMEYGKNNTDVIKGHIQYICSIKESNNLEFDHELNIPITTPAEMMRKVGIGNNIINKKIIEFIDQFKSPNVGVMETIFLYDRSYYFATILCNRFNYGEIYYLPDTGHFVTLIVNRFYDIRGDRTAMVESEDLYIKWSEYADYNYADYQKVMKTNITFLNKEEVK